jgi:hypothetical protein
MRFTREYDSALESEGIEEIDEGPARRMSKATGARRGAHAPSPNAARTMLPARNLLHPLSGNVGTALVKHELIDLTGGILHES